jgi:hypothetical protein
VEHLKAALLGQAPALPANIRLGWKGLTESNTLAYYKSFIVQALGAFGGIRKASDNFFTINI